ncbi:E3 ubiquitin-protein ligase rnf213-alpha-like [Saccostrea cucullata]|uniref:E3 ubiquitin-protein ligase rnf213-alpha-like n=1 Tax=Saccostrea cuccullata TaxID=36930 RepID=UPI002ED17F9A
MTLNKTLISIAQGVCDRPAGDAHASMVLQHARGVTLLTISTSPELKVKFRSVTSLVLSCNYSVEHGESISDGEIKWQKQINNSFEDVAVFSPLGGQEPYIHPDMVSDLGNRTKLVTLNTNVYSSATLVIHDVVCGDEGLYQCWIEYFDAIDLRDEWRKSSSLFTEYKVSRKDNGMKFLCSSQNNLTQEPGPEDLKRISVLYEPGAPVIDLVPFKEMYFAGDDLKLECVLTVILPQDKIEFSCSLLLIYHIPTSEGRGKEIKNLVRDFIEAWQCVREQLLTFTFPTLEGLGKVPKEYCQKMITESHPVSVLLPTFRDAGLCSYGLLYFLLKKQNNFLQEYCKKKKMQYTQLPKVTVNDITSPHLISYHPDRDILPMVLANCHYTFQVGKGTKIDYNFGDLERQLMDRFLFSKSVIDMPVYEFELMTYRSETTNAVVFRHLRQKIKQEPLTPAVANQISEEIRAYPDLCQTLDKLDITISFLKSVGGDANMSLEKFMTQTLKMENPFPSQKARSSCVCKHAQSLWMTLAMEKTKRQASHKEDAFEGVSGELRVDLLPDQRDVITSFCEELSIERLELLLETLFECIMLTITVPKGTDDDDLDMTKLSLRDTMIGYLSAPQYDLDLTYPGWMTDLVGRIPNEGENFTKIMNNQAVDVWLFLYVIYSQKRIERR